MKNAREYRHKWGKIGPSHLLRERGDLSFYYYCFLFSKQCLGKNHLRKVSKNSSATCMSEKLPFECLSGRNIEKRTKNSWLVLFQYLDHFGKQF